MVVGIIKKYTAECFHSAGILCARLCIAKQNLSIGVNVVSEGYPSLILRVLLISLGITILPKSSTRRTIPVAVPDICLRRQSSLASVDRGHSLCSFFLPQAAVASLPSCFHISFSFSAAYKVPLCKGGWQKSLISDWGIVFCRYATIPPSRLRRATFLYTREAFRPTIILQITLLVSVKKRRLYRRIYFFGPLWYNAPSR